MKYDEFNNLITEMSRENISEDYWYDVGVDEAISLIKKFIEEDWLLLEKNIINKSLEWQKKVIYCFEQQDNPKELTIILSLIDTNDTELFEMCIDSLRFKINKSNKKCIVDNTFLMEKLKEGALTNSIFSKLCKECLMRLENV